MTTPLITIGQMTHAERRWVSASWKKSVYGRRRRADGERLIQAIIDTQTVLVARAADDPETGVGWICFTALPTTVILHYVYVRGGGNGVRGSGFCRQLLAAAGVNTRRAVLTTTDRPRDADRAKRNGVVIEWFDPFKVLQR